jgi:hypothetical protein
VTLRLSSHPTAGIKSGIGRGDNVAFGEWHDPEYEVSMSDFMEACLYALLNTDLLPDDPRLIFIERVKGLEIVAGYNKFRNPDCKRLAPRPATTNQQERG